MGDAAKKVTHEFLVEKLSELPTLPTVVYELSALINDPMSSTTDIERVMEKDISLTTKVLKLINSAYYAIPGGVTQLSRAIAYLGFDTVNQLVLSASILKALKVNGPVKFDLNQFWVHALGVGMAAESIAKATGHKLTADMFTCGLVHDLGKVAMCIIDPEVVAKLSDHAHAKDMTYHDAELELGILEHTQIGHMLAKKWNLPYLIQTTVLYHHERDPLKRGGVSPEVQRSIDTVLLANLLIQALKFGNSGHSKVSGAPKPVLERLGIDDVSLPKVLAGIKSSLQSADNFLKIIQGG